MELCQPTIGNFVDAQHDHTSPEEGGVIIVGGLSGYSGYSSYSGYSGVSGYSSDSGYSGISGYSGSGVSGYSGLGISGYSGYSGLDGIATYSGYSGYSSDSGYSGYSSDSGYSGYSGFSSDSGYSGYSGYSSDSGYSGYSSDSGYSGISGSAITNEQYILSSLASAVEWDIAHSTDASFKRMVQIWKDRVATNISLDFDTADAGLFIQEDVTKTDFVSNQLQLKGINITNIYAHWMLNESSGTAVADSSGNGRNGITVNSPVWTAGKLNNCLNFNGTNQYVNCNSIASFERTQAFSIETWIKTATNNVGMICAKAVDATTYRGYALYIDTGKLVFYLISDNTIGNQITVNTTATINDNNWHHVVLTYNGSSNASGIIIYKDGVSVPLTTTSNALSATIVNAASFTIGARNSGVSSYITGNLDELLVYDKVLSLSEVTFRYNSGNGTEVISQYDTSQGWYVTTGTNQIDTTIWANINSITFTQTTPASTQLRYLISVDGRTTWNRWTGAAWAVETLVNLHTNGNTKAELEALSHGDWSTLFVVGVLDFAFGLKSTLSSNTPLIDQLNVNYGLMGKRLCTAGVEITVDSTDSTHTKITNISGSTLTDLRANFDF